MELTEALSLLSKASLRANMRATHKEIDLVDSGHRLFAPVLIRGLSFVRGLWRAPISIFRTPRGRTTSVAPQERRFVNGS